MIFVDKLLSSSQAPKEAWIMKCANCGGDMIRSGNKDTREPKWYCPGCHNIVLDRGGAA